MHCSEYIDRMTANGTPVTLLVEPNGSTHLGVPVVNEKCAVESRLLAEASQAIDGKALADELHRRGQFREQDMRIKRRNGAR